MYAKITEQEFIDIFEIMQQSFPDEEYRNYNAQKELLNQNNYNIVFKKNDENRVICFIASWEFENFIFIEHFAVAQSTRNSGIGSAFLKEFLSQCNKNVVLEVEVPTTEIKKRRIGFYKRLGFYLNNYAYLQPAMRENTLPIPLKIMSNNTYLNELEFYNIKDTLYKIVYKVNDTL